jgi:glycosyltransferase involved in cell wall biosynthesis
MRKLVENKSRGLDVPIAVIPNWAELEEVRPRDRCENGMIDKLGIVDKLIILHAGNIGYPTDVETIIALLNRLVNDDRFHFVFIGSGVKRRLLQNAIDKLGLSNLTLIDPRPRSEQIDFLNACDIGLVSLVPKMYGTAMPSKAYNIMAAGKPILALTDGGSELAMVVDENQIGWHLVSGNVGLLENVLNEIYERRDELPQMGKSARAAAEKSYSLSLAIQRYKKELS